MKKLKKSIKNTHKPTVASTKKTDESIEIFKVKITGTRLNQVLSKIWLQRKEMLHVATVNPEYIMEAKVSPKFASVLSNCLTVADGHGVVWASQILGDRREERGLERISGTQLVEEILKHASEKGEKVFLLGAAGGVAEKAAEAMSRKYPGLQIGYYEGAKSVSVERSEEASMTIAKINTISPDYLLVAYGAPWQDIWIEENRPYLRVRVAIGVGGVFDEWAGVVSICPAWIDEIGMKWMWRLVHEPRRWRRILKVLQFGILVLYHKLID